MKANWTLAVILLGLAVGFAAVAHSEDPNTARVDEVTQLRADVILLRSQVKSQAAEIERLKARLSQAPGASSKPATSQPAALVLPPKYNGREMTVAEFDAMYKKYANKIALMDGNYIDIEVKRWPVNSMVGGKRDETAGTSGGARVVQIINDTEILAHRSGGYLQIGSPGSPLPPGTPVIYEEEMSFHLKGIQTKGLVDGSYLGSNGSTPIMIRNGTYHYTSIDGAGATVPSYTVVATQTESFSGTGATLVKGPTVVTTTLTKQEFADALAKGIKLPK